jgi:hypothetical protein
MKALAYKTYAAGVQGFLANRLQIFSLTIFKLDLRAIFEVIGV